MRKLLVALVLCAALPAPGLGVPCRIVSYDRGSVTVELSISDPVITPIQQSGDARLSRISLHGFQALYIEGEPILPARRLIFAVPAAHDVTLEILDQDAYFIEDVRPSVTLAKGSAEDERRALARSPALGEQRFARLSGIEKIRGRDCAFVDVYPVLFDPQGERLSCTRRLLLRLSFPQAEEGRAAAKGSFILDDIVINAEQAASWKRTPERTFASERTPFEFARSNDWVKIRIKENGLYAVTYNDLLAAGASPAGIDPATLRLFSGGPYPEPDSLNQGGSFLDDYHFTEHAILYQGGSVGAFQPGDTMFFYGIGVDGWSNDVDPSADPKQYFKHPYATENVYWLTWGGSFTGSPRRMNERVVAPHGTPDTSITWYEARMRNEEDVLYDPIYTDDFWYWLLLPKNGNSFFSDDFYLSDLAGPSGVMKTMTYSPPHDIYAYPPVRDSATFRINNLVVGTLQWDPQSGYDPAALKKLEASVSNLAEGKNTYTVTKPDTAEAYIFWYEIFYRRYLRASQGAIDFHAPMRPLTAGFSLGGFLPGEKLLLDVSFLESPVLCNGWQPESGGLAFEDTLASYSHHYLAVSRSAFKKAVLEYVNVPSLRDEGQCPDIVVIYNGRFRTAALTLKAYHEQSLPGVEHPVVRAVDVEDVYDNFSGGHKDPIAIRNYLKFLYSKEICSNGGEPALKYVLLIGNGTYDARDLLKQGNDFIPIYINVNYLGTAVGVQDDDFLVKLDDYTDRAPDLAIGRMTVLTDREANAWAQRIVGYETNPDFGTWKNRVILAADDEFGSNGPIDFDFQNDTEALTKSGGPLPRFLDVSKIYEHLYPFLGDVKPSARKDLLKEWSDGALILHYDGHGSPLQWSDERLLVSSDVYSLTNAVWRPLVLSFSCDVGDFGSPYHRSLAQDMVTFDGGGAIATIAASAPTYNFDNQMLFESIYQKLFTSKDSTGTRPIGLALQLAKYSVVLPRGGRESNNSMYNVLGDPALRLAIPAYVVELETATIDTMYTGNQYRVEGSIKVGHQVLTSFNGVAEVTVQEAEKKVKEATEFREYALPGKALFRGTVDVVAGRFSVEFVVPRRCHTGPNARIRSYVTSSAIDGVGACDTLRIVAGDTLRPDLEPPSIKLYFAGQATKVKAGAKLMADISDSDGIAILGTDPQSSIYLEFDGSGYPIFVTDYFTYDHGSFTKGKVEYPLHAGFTSGQHSVVIRAFDNLGEASSDTLHFEIVEEGLYEVSDVFSFPNPFSRSTNFVFQVTNLADAKLTVYTVSGLKIWESVLAAEEGFNSINWDGRDRAGDRVANGTYLYVLEVDFRNSFHRKETVKGKIAYLR